MPWVCDIGPVSDPDGRLVIVHPRRADARDAAAAQWDAWAQGFDEQSSDAETAVANELLAIADMASSLAERWKQTADGALEADLGDGYEISLYRVGSADEIDDVDAVRRYGHYEAFPLLEAPTEVSGLTESLSRPRRS